jgi:hypothetical protein
MADIRKYAADETLANRDILLGRSAWQVSRFIQELMTDTDKMKLLLETLRVLRESAGPGKCRAEEEMLKILQRVAWECAGWLQEAGMTREVCRTAGLQSSDAKLQPRCAVLTLLAAFGRECFEFSRPRESFAGERRSLAFEILAVVGGLIDLPDIVELARQTVKKCRADALGALTFLEAYLGAREDTPDEDLKAALLAFAKRSKRRGLAVGALNVLVETGSISEFEACGRIDEWKTEHWGGG